MHPLWPRVQPCLPQLWRAVCGYEANTALQQELMQDVLLAILESLPRVRDPERLLPFVLRIAHNLGASHVRSALRSPRGVPLDEGVQAADGTAVDTADEDAEWLMQALRTLPLHLRQVLLLQLEGFDYRDIAAMLGISVQNVGVRAHRARRQLQALADAEAGDGSG